MSFKLYLINEDLISVATSVTNKANLCILCQDVRVSTQAGIEDNSLVVIRIILKLAPSLDESPIRVLSLERRGSVRLRNSLGKSLRRFPFCGP
jgi:hypothetical protein